MKPKRMIPPLLPLSSSTPRCLASSSRALLFQSNYDFAISFPDHPLRLVDVVFRVPIVKLSLSLFFLFLDSLSLYSFRNQRDREFAEMARRTEISLSKDCRVRCYIASVDKKKGVRNILSMRLEDISFQRAICDWKIRE